MRRFCLYNGSSYTGKRFHYIEIKPIKLDMTYIYYSACILFDLKGFFVSVIYVVIRR